MSVISAVARVAGGILLFLGIVGLVVSNAMAQFTDYDKLKPAIAAIAEQQIPAPSQATFEEIKARVSERCAGIESLNLADVVGGAPNVTLKCADVIAVSSPADLSRLVAEAAFDNLYYKQYSCDFVSCVTGSLPAEEKGMLMASAHANGFFKQTLLWAAAIAVLGVALISFAVRRLFGIMKNVGIELAAVGIVSYFSLNFVNGTLSSMIPVEDGASLIAALLANISMGYAIVAAVGAALAVSGWLGGRYAKSEKSAKKKR